MGNELHTVVTLTVYVNRLGISKGILDAAPAQCRHGPLDVGAGRHCSGVDGDTKILRGALGLSHPDSRWVNVRRIQNQASIIDQ